MQATVIVEDPAVRLPLGRPQLCVLSVSGAVCQCHAPDPAGRAVDWRGAAQGEEATRAGKGSCRQGANRGIGEGGTHKVKRKHPRTTECPEYTPATGYRREREEEGGRRRNRGHSGWGGGRAAMCPGTSQPWRTYVSGRSTGTGFTGTRAHISTAASNTTRRGRRGGVTLRSCNRGATTRGVGRLADGSSVRWGWRFRGCGIGSALPES